MITIPATPLALEGGLRPKGTHKKSQPGKPLVTIITATFNDADNLLRTVKAVRELTYKNVEWIIVDGGSKDRTVEMIRLNENVIDYWISEPDAGIYDAWNKGVSRANGDWISFLGAGDCYHPDAIDRYVSAIEALPSIPRLVSSLVRHVDRGGKTLRVWGGELESEKFRKYLPISHCGTLHHRSLFEKYGLFDTSYASAADYEFLMRCRADLNAIFVNAVTTDMLVGGVSNGYKGLFETYRIQRKYGEGASAMIWLGIACAKRFVRPWLRGY